MSQKHIDSALYVQDFYTHNTNVVERKEGIVRIQNAQQTIIKKSTLEYLTASI